MPIIYPLTYQPQEGEKVGISILTDLQLRHMNLVSCCGGLTLAGAKCPPKLLYPSPLQLDRVEKNIMKSSQVKIRTERSLTDSQHRQNRFSLGILTEFITNKY